MSPGTRCTYCRPLYSLGAECLVLTLTLVHVLMSTVELLIHLDVIQVPISETDNQSTAVPNQATTISPSSPSQSYDPGGCDTSMHPHLSTTVIIVRYATLCISASFLMEIVCRAVYLRKHFFTDLWQLFDTLIVLLSLGVEIAFFLMHEKLVCYHPATEAAKFVIVLRLWRIPRACNVRKKEYTEKLDDEHRYMRQTKVESEKKCKRLEIVIQEQTSEIENLKYELSKNTALVNEETERIPNGTVPIIKDMNAADKRILDSEPPSNTQGDSPKKIDKDNAITDHAKTDTDKAIDTDKHDEHASNKCESNLERNDSDKNSRANDSGIEVKDSFRSEKERTTIYSGNTYNEDDVFDSDGSEFPVPVRKQEVRVQIEEISRQNQLPSVTSFPRSVGDDDEEAVLVRRVPSKKQGAYCLNAAFDADVVDGRGTYRSADYAKTYGWMFMTDPMNPLTVGDDPGGGMRSTEWPLVTV